MGATAPLENDGDDMENYGNLNIYTGTSTDLNNLTRRKGLVALPKLLQDVQLEEVEAGSGSGSRSNSSSSSSLVMPELGAEAALLH